MRLTAQRSTRTGGASLEANGSSLAFMLALLLLSSPALGQVTEDRSDLFGAIIGRVCEDVNADGVCSASEPGLSRARVELETGQWCVTDSDGRYHLAGVTARQLEPTSSRTGLRFSHGRHRVKVDPRSLPPAARLGELAATVELPAGGMTVRDFALRRSLDSASAAPTATADAPPSATREGASLRFHTTGQVQAGAQVWVNGTAANVDARGRYGAWVEVRPGPNALTVRVQSPDGMLRIASQQVDVVERSGGALFIPRPLTEVARAQLPAGASDEPVDSGKTHLKLWAPAGTRIRLGDAEVTVGPSGGVTVPVDLRPGTNALALRLTVPGQPETSQSLELLARSRPLASALLDVELGLSLRGEGLSFAGRGAGKGEAQLGGWTVAGAVDLQDQDLAAGSARALLAPRAPERLERWLDTDEVPSAWADEATGGAPSSAEGRLRLSATHERFGEVGFGTQTVGRMDVDVGRFRRSLFGAYVDLHTPLDAPASARLKGFYAPTGGDPTRGLALVPAHDELLATGGSLFFLGHGAIASGTESLRRVLRDGLTGLPLEEQLLLRGRDYEIDYRSGHVVLAQPSSIAASEGFFRSDGPSGQVEEVLVADYERLTSGDAARSSAGAELAGTWGPATLGAAVVRQENPAGAAYQLLRAHGRLALLGYSLRAELAQSRGQAVAPEDVGLSEDGGLAFLRPGLTAASSFEPANALTLRLTGPGLWERGGVDVAFRRRTPGYSDSTHHDGLGLRQLSVRARQAVGGFSFGLMVDDRTSADPRAPFSDLAVSARVAGGWAAFSARTFDVRLEAKDSALTAAPDLSTAPLSGARTSVALSGRYQLLAPLWLTAGHKQVLSVRGEGLGAVDDSLSTVGVEWALDPRSRAGLRAGYGPSLGLVVLGDVQAQRGADTWYGSYTADVEGTDLSTSGLAAGGPRAVTGARTQAGDGTSVFVEDVGTREAQGLRLSRAVGVTQALASSLQLAARYERGARHPLDAAPALAVDAGSVSLSAVHERVRGQLRAELRHERGQALLWPSREVDRTVRLLTLAVDSEPAAALGLSGRVHYADATEAGVTAARLLEGHLSATWRFGPGAVVLHYAVVRELPPPSRGSPAERTVHRVSLLPAVALGDRFSLSAGAHVAYAVEEGSSVVAASGSLRPAVRVVAGLEVAAEVAARTWTADGAEWHALRAELGYRFADALRVAAGYTLAGFSGLGLLDGQASAQDRLYLRAEVAY